MRFSAIIPLLCTITALILSLLCLFAGSTRSFLQHGDLLTLNLSRLGHTPAFNTSDGSGGFFSNLFNEFEGELNHLIGDAESDIAGFFDLHDFYSAHIMNYCEGYYEPNATAHKASENITHCSNRTAFFHFDPTAIVQKELRPGINLTDLHWPSEIESAVHTIEVASKVMFVFYVIGIAFSGLAVLGAVFGVFSNGRISAFLNFGLDFLAFFAIVVASIISTVIIVKAVNAVNKYGELIGIAATKGTTFLGMTWAATAVMLLASFMWIAECCAGRKKRRVAVEKGEY